jgi:hypothetical protein
MLEFALLAPVLFLMIMGLIDVARAVYDYNVISNAAREGVREAVLRYNQCANDNSVVNPPVTWKCPPPPPTTTANSSLVGVDNAITRAGAGSVGFVFKTNATGPNATAPSCTPLDNQGCVWVFIVNKPSSSPPTGACVPPNPVSTGGTDNWPSCDFDANKRSGSYDVVVEIKYKFTPLTALAANALGNNTILWAKSEMRTEY